MNNRLLSYRYHFLAGLGCLALGSLSGISMTTNDLLWYHSLMLPTFTPPAAVFGPVWSLLYIMIGIVGWSLWKDSDREGFSFMVWVTQLVLNLIWTPIFFHYRYVGIALFDITFLWIAILILLILIRKKPIFWLTLPYFCWVSFAAFLNASIYHLNF